MADGSLDLWHSWSTGSCCLHCTHVAAVHRSGTARSEGRHTYSSRPSSVAISYSIDAPCLDLVVHGIPRLQAWLQNYSKIRSARAAFHATCWLHALWRCVNLHGVCLFSGGSVRNRCLPVHRYGGWPQVHRCEAA